MLLPAHTVVAVAVIVTDGVTLAGGAFRKTFSGAETQPPVFLAVMLYSLPPARLPNTLLFCQAPPSMLYCSPDTDCTVMLPAVAQSGWVTDSTEGAAGAPGAALTVT